MKTSINRLYAQSLREIATEGRSRLTVGERDSLNQIARAISCKQWVVVLDRGDDGLAVFGPFKTETAAAKYAIRKDYGNYYIDWVEAP